MSHTIKALTLLLAFKDSNYVNLAELNRFVPIEVTKNNIEFNKNHTTKYIAFIEDETFRQTIWNQNYDLFYTWDCLFWAQRNDLKANDKVYWLKELRKRLGDKNYYEGRMPDPVVLTYFKEVKYEDQKSYLLDKKD